jgi:hypothetical protein
MLHPGIQAYRRKQDDKIALKLFAVEVSLLKNFTSLMPSMT